MVQKIISVAICCLFILCLNQKTQAQQITVNGGTGVSAATLVSTIIGSGVTATNITYTGSPLSKGTFTAYGTNLGFTGGITLSTGNATLGPMIPASVNHSSAMLGNTDAQLNALVSPQVTTDAAVLEFDFAVASDSVKFNYVFGSEEYNEYVNSTFNDVFAFYISGPGITGSKNMALIPGTNTPVSINTVNNGTSGTGPCTNCNYFINNSNGTSVFLDGLTTPLAAASVVHPCENYHMKIAIADVYDQVFDSDVFIQQSSFASLGQTPFYVNNVPAQVNDTIYGCAGGTVTLGMPNAGNYNWSTGATTQQIVVPVPAAGNFVQYSGFIANPPSYTCFAYTTTIWLAQGTPPTASIIGATNYCPGGSTQLSANTGNSFIWSTGATTKSISVSNAGTYTVTITLSGGCTRTVSKTASPYSVAVPVITGGDTPFCNGTSVSLSANAGYTSYLWSAGGNGTSTIVNTPGAYTVTVTDSHGCTATKSKTITQFSLLVLTETHVNPACFGNSNGSINLTVNGGKTPYKYQWNSLDSVQDLFNKPAGNYGVTVTDSNLCSKTLSVSLTQPTALSITSTSTFATCSNPASGTADVTVTGGTPPYTYLWNGGNTNEDRNNLTTGNHTVTATDARGCSIVRVTYVSPPPGFAIVMAVNGFCHNGTSGALSADPSPFLTTYNYLWSNGATVGSLSGLQAGTYTVTVTDTYGCTVTQSRVINNPPALVVTSTQVNVNCNGKLKGSINLAVSGGIPNGSPAYFYSWSNGAITQNLKNLPAGTYTATVRDQLACTKSITCIITEPPAITYTKTITKVSCNGGNDGKIALVTAGGTSPYLYSWNTSPVQTSALATALTAASYLCTITDANACTKKTTNIAVGQPTKLLANITLAGSSATVAASGGTTPYKYTWNTIPVQTNATATGLSTGTYIVTVKDKKNCTKTASIIVPGPRLGSDDKQADELNAILVPNPSDGAFNIEINSIDNNAINFELINAEGKIVVVKNLTLKTGINIFEHNYSNLPKGLYMVRLTNSSYVKNLKLILH